MSRHDWPRRAASPTALLVLLAAAAALRAGQGTDPAGPLRTLDLPPGHSDLVASLGFSNDGESLTVRGGAGEVTSLRVRRGDCRSALPGSAGPTHQLALAPDSGTLARVGPLGAVSVWDLTTGRALAGPWERAGSTDTTRLAYSGRLLAVGDTRGLIRLWHTADRTACATLHRNPNPVSHLNFGRGGSVLVATHFGGTVEVWDPMSGRLRSEFLPPAPARPGDGDAPPAVAVSPDGLRYAVSCLNGRSVSVWDLDTGRQLLTFRGHSGSVWSLAYSPDGRMIASGDWRGVVKLWDAATGDELAGFRGHLFEVKTLAFSPDQTALATAGTGEGVRLWDVRRALASSPAGAGSGGRKADPGAGHRLAAGGCVR